MSRLTTVSTVSMLGVISALLAGCPVWGPEPRGDGGAPDGHASCSSNSDCADNQYCNYATHECVNTPSCGAGGTCTAGYFCDSRNVCVPGCRTNTDCTALGQGLVCNTSTSRCEPSNQCDDTHPCGPEQTCVGGSCRATNTLCQFNYQCNAGQECVDGRCLNPCNAGSDAGTSCPTGSVCRDGYCQAPLPSGGCDCGPTQVCSNNVCLNACMRDADCGTGNFCDNGVCRVDDRRPTNGCGATGTCAPGSVCVDGACRIACPPGNPTAMGCQTINVSFNTCDTSVMPTPICRYSNEIAPQCARNIDCGAGRICVNALCRN